MKSSRLFIALLTATALLHTAAASAAAIDMDDPRRVIGKENNVRVDAQLIQDTVSPGTPIGIVYQVQNQTSAPIALAANVASASFDSDTGPITFSIGAEIPPAGPMPRMELIAPGETKVLRAGSGGVAPARSTNPRFGGQPRYVRVKVSFLRDVEPFATLIAKQTAAGGAQFPDALFHRWFESQDTIFMNAVPVRFSPRAPGADASVGAMADASHRF